ncbi:hypothetical protein [Natronolimnobius baerhuensis]|uniref:DUF8097 domain-containing protein n=1 Tax=Natronolimnobius baerhuensis TaxID=253108 RepID=A0A202E8E5_9EURY|nr:hypothetical protein [Natronolimnobius baerhuensis]OVE84533.1 hypothetical protein B2G88_09005 [Natronolimnobius baerhuensis]
MGRPWKRIALDVVVGLTALLAAQQLRHLEEASPDPEGITLRPRWALVGALSSSGWGYASDVDFCGLRRSRLRRGVATVIWSALLYRLQPNDSSTTYSVAVGNGLGTLAYRFWFGVVRPRPGGTE